AEQHADQVGEPEATAAREAPVIDCLPSDQGAHCTDCTEGQVQYSGGSVQDHHPDSRQGIHPAERQAGDKELFYVSPTWHLVLGRSDRLCVAYLLTTSVGLSTVRCPPPSGTRRSAGHRTRC